MARKRFYFNAFYFYFFESRFERLPLDEFSQANRNQLWVAQELIFVKNSRTRNHPNFSWALMHSNCVTAPHQREILGSIVVSISACHAEDLGSISGRGAFFLFFFLYNCPCFFLFFSITVKSQIFVQYCKTTNFRK